MDRMYLARAAVIAAVFAGSILLVDASSVKSIDTNGDGFISVDEARAAALAKFESLDKDHDGTIDAKEGKGLALRQLDTDRDGTVDKDEYLAAVQSLFKQADKDGNSSLDAKEYKAPAGRKLAKLL